MDTTGAVDRYLTDAARAAQAVLRQPESYAGADGGGPERECDVVMKGGITSGVVYPLHALVRDWRTTLEDDPNLSLRYGAPNPRPAFRVVPAPGE